MTTENQVEVAPTLRDLFALGAMQGMVVKTGKTVPAQTAQSAYEIADAMMEARKVNPAANKE